MSNPQHWTNRQLHDLDFTNDTFEVPVVNCTFFDCVFDHVVFDQIADANLFIGCAGIIRFVQGGDKNVVDLDDGLDGGQVAVERVPANWYLDVATGDVSEFL